MSNRRTGWFNTRMNKHTMENILFGGNKGRENHRHRDLLVYLSTSTHAINQYRAAAEVIIIYPVIIIEI